MKTRNAMGVGSLRRAVDRGEPSTSETFWVTSRVHELDFEKRKWIPAIVALTPFVILGVLRALSIYYAKPIAVAVAIPLLLVAVATHVISNKVVVGSDAISTQWLGRLVVIPLREIDRVDSIDAARDGSRTASVCITRRDGTCHYILVGRDDPQRERLVKRIRAALLARDGLGGAADTAFLARGERDGAAWVAALRELGSGAEGGMRRAPLPRERLWKVVEDTDAAPLDRAAAAVAVAARASAEERQRIRIAADGSADPNLRVALERSIAAEQEDEAVHEALVALETSARS